MLSSSQRWHDSARLLYEFGARLFVELPPGHTLSSLVRAGFPQARAVAAADTDPASIVQRVRAGAAR